MRTRLEFVEGTSSKFWQADVDGTQVRVTFGRIGTAGQVKIHACASETEATTLAQQLIAEKVKKGYRQVDAPEGAPAAPEKPPASAKKATPKPSGIKHTFVGPGGADDTTHFIQLGTSAAALDNKERMFFVLGKRGYTLLRSEPVDADQIADASVESSIEVAVEGATTTLTCDEGLTAAKLGAALKRIEGSRSTCVKVVSELHPPGKSWEKAIQDHALPAVTSFIFDTPHETQTRQQANSLGDLSITLRQLPAVERLWATGKSPLTACRHETLQTLALLGNPLPAATLKGLGGCAFPRLRELRISLASDAGPAAAQNLNAALATLDAPLLETVVIDGVKAIEKTLEVLLTAPARTAVRRISLEGTVDEDALLATVQRHAARVSALESLGLPLADECTEETEEALRALYSGLDESTAGAFLPEAYATW